MRDINMSKRKYEKGSAQLTLKLQDSKIIMYHTNTNGQILNSWNALEGDWDNMFSNILNTFPKMRKLMNDNCRKGSI